MDAAVAVNVLGWLGSFAVVLAYGLISANRVQSDSLGYQLLNLFGAAFLIINTIYWGAYPASFVNLFWIVIAVSALARMARR